jgi:hypothetical protein
MALLVAMPKNRKPVVATPEFHVVAVRKLLGAFCGVVICGAPEINTVLDVTIGANDERAIVLHGSSLFGTL